MLQVLQQLDLTLQSTHLLERPVVTYLGTQGPVLPTQGQLILLFHRDLLWELLLGNSKQLSSPWPQCSVALGM